MTHDVTAQRWEVAWDDAGGRLVTTPASGGAKPAGELRALEGRCVAIDGIRGVQGWIDGPHSGVRVHLEDGGAVEVLFSDSGNVDFTATGNEYYFDGKWAFAAARQLAAWLGVPCEDGRS